MRYAYDIIISPLIFVYDLLFTLINRTFSNPVGAIIVLSLIINTAILPLYKKADAMQKEEQEKKLAMTPWVKHIQKNFHGDEQFMMLQTYYRIEHYSPLSFLKEAVPLLLQIPFFIAAYRFISSLAVLDGASFGPIQNLLAPDGLLAVGRLTVNVLPILMTVINLISGVIYSQGSTTRLRIQIVVTASVFLVLLYNSPSALVIYWTMNNLYSLAKNIVFRFSDKYKKLIKVAISFFLVFLTEYLAINNRMQFVLAEVIIFALLFYAAFQLGKEKLAAKMAGLSSAKLQPTSSFFMALSAELALAILLGLYIPSSVLVASPLEFIDSSTGVFHTELITDPAMIYIGLCLLWLTVIYFSKEETGRRMFAIVLSAGLLFAVLNQFVFIGNFGTLYTDLQFDGTVKFPALLVIVNAAAGLLVLAGCSFLFYKNPILLRRGITLITAALFAVSIWNVHVIKSQLGGNPSMEATGEGLISSDGIFRLSRTGKNVIVLMLDRAIGSYVPFIFDEKPGLKEAFQGFVLYPNTVSFGTKTNFGTPGLFGGYEYTPYESNQRDTVSLEQKQNEALKLMPVLFLDNGYDVTLCDPPYAGYQDVPDLSIYDDYPEIKSYVLNGKLTSKFEETLGENDFSYIQNRNFSIYSLYRTAPLFLRSFIYDEGHYLYNHSANTFSQRMLDSYSVLASLNNMTITDNDTKNSFLLLQNETPHNPTALVPPDYRVEPHDMAISTEYADRVIQGKVLKINNSSQWGHYCINVATYQAVAEWLKYLREEGVYDNTRIILVADHGYPLRQFDDLIHTDGLDVESLNPLLMVKDFYSHDPWTINMTFMTNADVPTLAMQDVIEDPVNPFTGNPVSNEKKYMEPVIVTDSKNWRIEKNNGTTFDLEGGNWWSVHDSIFDMRNWKRLDAKDGR